ncbi:MAG: hypothetical protein ABW360_16025 [Phenylobacterium sp.]
MNPTIRRLALIFLGVFAVLTAGVFVLQSVWISPQKKCEAAHKWWDAGQRVCAQPILISDVTGRVITDDKARAEAEAAVGRAPMP